MNVAPHNMLWACRPRALSRAVASSFVNKRVSTLMFAAAFTLGASTATHAATFTVTNTNSAGPGSLRQAIADANNHAYVKDTIVFASGVSGTINLTSGSGPQHGALTISDPVVIEGPGPDKLAINANGNDAFRVFQVEYGTTDTIISGLTLSNGRTGVNGSGNGAFYSFTVRNCVITGMSDGAISRTNILALENSRIISNGGGVAAHRLRVTNSVIAANAARGMVANDEISLVDSIVSGNLGNGLTIAPARYPDANVFSPITVQNSVVSGNAGDGVYSANIGANLTVTESTIADNARHGIALVEFDAKGYGDYSATEFHVVIQNSTISGNAKAGLLAHTGDFYSEYFGSTPFATGASDIQADNTTIVGNGDGGLIVMVGSGGSIAPGGINRSTIAGNAAKSGSGISVVLDPSATDVATTLSLAMDSTIVARNAASRRGPDLFTDVPGFFFAANYSLVENPAEAPLHTTAPGSNIFGEDPRLGRLQNLGGSTLVRGLLGNSPARDRGNPRFARAGAADQRGVNFARVAGGRMDIGAVEQQVNDVAPVVLRMLPDLNGNSTPELAALVHKVSTQTTTAQVRDTQSGALITRASFPKRRETVDMQTLPDVNGNGKRELAVLYRGPTSVSVRDAATGAVISDLSFTAHLFPKSLGITPDISGNGRAEVAVLATQRGATIVELRDSVAGNLVNRVAFTASGTARNVVVLPGTSGSGSPELAVLFDSLDPALPDTVQIRDAATDALVRNIVVGSGATAMALVPDVNGNGHDELAVLQSLSRVTLLDSATGAALTTLDYDPFYLPQQIVVEPDTNGNGAAEIAVLGRSLANGSLAVESRDAATGQRILVTNYDATFRPDDLAVVPDINGNGVSEVVHGGVNAAGNVRAALRDVATGTLVNNIDF